MSILLSPDVDKRVRALADEQGSTIARAMDMLIRDALEARSLTASRTKAADRLDRVVALLADLPFGPVSRQAYPRYEQGLLSSVMAGCKTVVPALQALNSDVFAYRVHQIAWELLAEGKHVTPGPGAADALSLLVVRHVPEIQPKYFIRPIDENADENDNDRPAITIAAYFDALQKLAPYFIRRADFGIYPIVDAFLQRRTETQEVPFDHNDTSELYDAIAHTQILAGSYILPNIYYTYKQSDVDNDILRDALSSEGIDPDEVLRKK